MKNKKGQAITLGKAPSLVLILALTVMIAASVALALNSFKETQCANSGFSWTGVICSNNATGYEPRGDYAVNASQSGLEGLSNFSGQVPTIGTIIGVALIVVVVVGAFAFFLGGRKGAL